jgi:hypothetical protein|tara:strand:- start:353 stop:796 length:444 start_codon:yes stop_codon:yes gene_type:complete
MSAAVIHTLIFDAIIKTSQRVFFLVEEMSINGDSLFNQFVNETDIYARLDVIEALMKDIYNHGSSISPILSKTVEISLEHVEKIVKIIENELQNLKDEVELYNLSYMSYIKSFDYSNKINILKKHITTMESRLNTLITILNIHGFTN